MPHHEHWQLEGSTPELYERYLVPAITSLWAADLIGRAPLRPNDRVLDIACGTGVVTRLAAERITVGRIVGLDLNPGMLAVARIAGKGAPIEWLEGSALSLPFEDSCFDVLFCQLGLQFFPDRSLALREMKRVLAPLGRVALSVYSAIEHTPAAYAFVRALDRHLGTDASKIKRSEHIFGDVGEIETLMTEAGFEQVTVDTVLKRITFPSVLDYVRFQLIATPMAALLRTQNDIERETIIGAIAAETRSLLDAELVRDGRLSSPQEAYVATALAT